MSDANPIATGKQKVATAELEMFGIRSLVDSYEATQPLKGTSFLVCVTPTPETGVFLIALKKLGARIAACSDNAYAADDDVVAYLRSIRIAIFARSNMEQAEYFASMAKAVAIVERDSTIHIVDDGCDITRYIARSQPQLLAKTRLITEQTACGINALQHLFRDAAITAPAVNINDCFTKRAFDNYIGIQQSLIHALTVAGISIPGKVITIFGYGHVGQGAAKAMQVSGARVQIVEQDLILLMQAELEGLRPVSAEEALWTSDLCLTATGCLEAITGDMITKHARSGLMLGNIGHGSEEYDVVYLERNAAKTILNRQIDEFTLDDGRKIYSLCKGALVNFLAGGGNMPRLMSLTFTLTILAHLQATQCDRQQVGLHSLDSALELECAERNFSHLKPLVYQLNTSQHSYIAA